MVQRARLVKGKVVFTPTFTDSTSRAYTPSTPQYGSTGRQTTTRGTIDLGSPKKTGAFATGEKGTGFYTSDGKFYPTSVSTFVPMGYSIATNVDIGNLIRSSGNFGKITVNDVLRSPSRDSLIKQMQLKSVGYYKATTPAQKAESLLKATGQDTKQLTRQELEAIGNNPRAIQQLQRLQRNYYEEKALAKQQRAEFELSENPKKVLAREIQSALRSGNVAQINRVIEIAKKDGRILSRTSVGLEVSPKTKEEYFRGVSKLPISQESKRLAYSLITPQGRLGVKYEKEDFPSTYRVAPKEKEFLERALAKERELKSKALTSLERTQKPEERIAKGIVVLGALGAYRGLLNTAYTIRHPLRSLKSLAMQVRHPILTLGELGQQFTIDPVGTAAEFYAYNKAMAFTNTLIKKSPVGRFVSEELYIRSQPKEIRPYVRAIIKSSKIQEGINPFNIKSIKKVDFVDVKNLNRIEAKALVKTLKKTDSVIFGSLAGKTLGKTKMPKPKDVDLATRDIKLFNKEFINNLPKNVRKGYQVKNQKIVRKLDGEKILDVKPIERLIPERSILTKTGRIPVSGYVKKLSLKGIKNVKSQQALSVPTQKLVKVGKFKLVGFGEQTTRKGLGTIQVLIEKNARRAKDPAAFISSLEVQLDSLLSKPKNVINKYRINRIKSAIDILTSKSFKNLLNRKVKGLTSEYPIISRYAKTLKKIGTRPTKKQIIKNYFTNKKVSKIISKKSFNNYLKRQSNKLLGSAYSYLPKLKRAKYLSYLQSYLPKNRYNKLQSYLPKNVRSRMPSSLIPSRIRSTIPKFSSKLYSLKLSRIPKASKLDKLAYSRLPKATKNYISSLPSQLRRGISSMPSQSISRMPSIIRQSISKLPSNIRKSISRLPNIYSRLIGITRIPKTTKPTEYIKAAKRQYEGIGFDVYAKKAGRKTKYVRINNSALSFINAISYGKYVIDKSPLASFKIIATRKKIKQKFNAYTPNYKFRLAKRLPKGVIVEKRKYRIDSYGEKQGITLKGLRKLRIQRLIKRFFK